ncbi:MAG: hypothetical protein LBD93_05065 [Treponema sp.]|nr:hypothetical protein [Treponema sp.]
MKEKNKYTWDGEPIYEAFNSEEEYQKAIEKRKEEILALWEDLEEHSKQWDTAHPEIAAKRRTEHVIAEAARAASEVAPEFAPEPNPSRRNPQP